MNSANAAMSPSRPTESPSLMAYSDAELLRQLDALLHARDPLRFALELLPHHFTLAIAPFHRQIVGLAFPQRVQEDLATPHGSESRAALGISPLPCSTSHTSLPPKFCSPPAEALTNQQMPAPRLVGLAAPRGL